MIDIMHSNTAAAAGDLTKCSVAVLISSSELCYEIDVYVLVKQVSQQEASSRSTDPYKAYLIGSCIHLWVTYSYILLVSVTCFNYYRVSNSSGAEPRKEYTEWELFISSIAHFFAGTKITLAPLKKT